MRTPSVQKKAIGGRGLRHSASVKMIQTPVSKTPIFRYIGVLDQCGAEHGVKFIVRSIRASKRLLPLA